MEESASQCLLFQLREILERESVQATQLTKAQPAQCLLQKVQSMGANINSIKSQLSSQLTVNAL
jgi:hypothetical protein